MATPVLWQPRVPGQQPGVSSDLFADPTDDPPFKTLRIFWKDTFNWHGAGMLNLGKAAAVCSGVHIDLIGSVLVWDRANSSVAESGCAVPSAGLRGRGNQWYWANASYAVQSALLRCHPGEGECFPALGLQQFGKSVGFSMESSI